jgi:hypothetical protein
MVKIDLSVVVIIKQVSIRVAKHNEAIGFLAQNTFVPGTREEDIACFYARPGQLSKIK